MNQLLESVCMYSIINSAKALTSDAFLKIVANVLIIFELLECSRYWGTSFGKKKIWMAHSYIGMVLANYFILHTVDDCLTFNKQTKLFNLK